MITSIGPQTNRLTTTTLINHIISPRPTRAVNAGRVAQKKDRTIDLSLYLAPWGIILRFISALIELRAAVNLSLHLSY